MKHTAAHGGAEGKRTATLYVVATPIGNLGDISLRALDVLKGVEAVGAEDTRITRRLLDHYGIATRLIAVHEHNERRAAKRVLALLHAGKSLALVCDAGTPAISDPGAHLIAAVRAAGHTVTPVPGANAAIAAFSVAGLSATQFLFYGFLPAAAGERRRELERLALLPYALVFYEAPHRVGECVAALRAVLGGEREVMIARELTKLFETVHRCRLAEAEAWLDEHPDRRRGEFVLVVEGAPARAAPDGARTREALQILLAELPLKRAVQVAAKLTGARKNELYRAALALKGER